jgi:hypothetical protein
MQLSFPLYNTDMMILLLAALLASPAAAQDVTTSAVNTPMPRETQEFMQWVGRRTTDLRLGDDQSEAVWRPQDKPGRLMALARLISDDRRLLWRYTSLLKGIQAKKGKVNPLDLDLSGRVWTNLMIFDGYSTGFKDVARSLGVPAPKLRDAMPASARGGSSPSRAGDERYDPDTGGYEVFDGSGTWKPK